MTLLWHFYWPVVLAGFIAGVLAGRIGFLRVDDDDAGPPPAPKGWRKHPLLLGLLAALVVAASWHLLGAGERFAKRVQANAAAELNFQEMTSVRAEIERGPMRRTLLLRGPADDFQRGELVRIMGDQPGVSTGRWINPPLGRSALLPLIVEAGIMALIGFLFGLLLSYLLELRRRSNAGWSW